MTNIKTGRPRSLRTNIHAGLDTSHLRESTNIEDRRRQDICVVAYDPITTSSLAAGIAATFGR